MKALFVGGFNDITVEFAAKLAKNGVAVAVSNHSSEKPNLGFSYTKYDPEKAYLTNMYRNFRPDTIIVTAGYDEDEELDLNLLQGVLQNAADNEIKKLILLSDTVVYGISDDVLLSEDTALRPKSKRAMYLAMAEDICKRFSDSTGLVITVMRIGGMYGRDMHGALLNRMIRQLINGETLHLDKNLPLAFLSSGDAAEAFYQIYDNSFSDCYNTTSNQFISPDEFKKTIEKLIPTAAKSLMTEGDVRGECQTADNSKLKKEYQWHERGSLTKDIEELLRSEEEYIKAQRKAQDSKQKKEAGTPKKRLLKVLWEYAEVVLVFLLLILMTNLQGSVELLQGIDFTVIYLVIVAVALNFNQAAFSLILSIGLLVFQKTAAGYDFFSAVISNQTLLLAAEYCIVSLGFSYVLQRHRTKTRLSKLETEEQATEMLQLKQFSEDNLKTRHFFEDQILSYEMSLPRVISMASRLDTLEPDLIIPETVSIISESVGAKDASAYFIGKRGGRMRLSYSKTEAAAGLGQSPLLDALSPMIRAIEEDGIFINLGLDENFPSLASGVKIGGRLTFVFTVWNLPFAEMRQDVSNLLKSITALVSAALTRAKQYEEITANERYLPDTAVIRPEMFRELCQSYLNGIGGVLCRIEGTKGEAAAFSRQLEPLIRESDYLGTDNESNLYVLLSGTTDAGYKLFSNRLQEKGIHSTAVPGGLI